MNEMTNKSKSQAFVFCAIASKDGFVGSVNIKDVNNSLHTYLCNAFVALKTTKNIILKSTLELSQTLV